MKVFLGYSNLSESEKWNGEELPYRDFKYESRSATSCAVMPS